MCPSSKQCVKHSLILNLSHYHLTNILVKNSIQYLVSFRQHTTGVVLILKTGYRHLLHLLEVLILSFFKWRDILPNHKKMAGRSKCILYSKKNPCSLLGTGLGNPDYSVYHYPGNEFPLTRVAE